MFLTWAGGISSRSLPGCFQYPILFTEVGQHLSKNKLHHYHMYERINPQDSDIHVISMGIHVILTSKIS
jgi:hypothetical protein